MLNLFWWYRCDTVEWHYRKMDYTSPCCHHFSPRCIQIQFWQRCVTVSTETAIHPEDTCSQVPVFFLFYCFFILFSLRIFVQKAKYFSLRFSYLQLNWSHEGKEAAHLTAERLGHETWRVTGAVVHRRVHGRTTSCEGGGWHDNEIKLSTWCF